MNADGDSLCERIRMIAAEDGDVERVLRELFAAVGRRREAVEAALESCSRRLGESPDDYVTARAVQMLKTALQSGVFAADRS